MNDKFAIGYLKIGNFLLWTTDPVFTDLTVNGLYSIDKHLSLPYYNCYLLELKPTKDFVCHYYINLVEKLKEYDKYFDFARPDKNINDEKELHHWVSGKELQMPLWHLRKETIQKIIVLLERLAVEGKSLLHA